jgi:hypothetical protein
MHYAVYSPEDSIIVRTHFLATSTLEQTANAYVRYCMRTEMEPSASRRMATVLLRRMVAFYHGVFVQDLPVSDTGIFAKINLIID